MLNDCLTAYMMNVIPYLGLSDEEKAGLGKEQEDRKKEKESEKQRKRKQKTRPGPSSKTDSSKDGSEPIQKKTPPKKKTNKNPNKRKTY